MKNTTTSLQNVADADILEAQKFGGVASGGVALTLANIVTALGYTPENVANKQNSLSVDGTGVKYPTVDAVNTGLALKANLASPNFTGTPTAPTATVGTNTTQLATTAFVLANTQPLIPYLEYSNSNKTIWNNGLGNLIFNTSFGDGALNVNTTGDRNSVYGYLA